MPERFRKRQADPNKLMELGFKKTESGWKRKQAIHQNDFELTILVTAQDVKMSVYDPNFQEEYIGYKFGDSEFALEINQEIDAILDELKNQAFKEVWFDREQANRIANKVYAFYRDKPEFIFKSDPDIGVFRNPNNEKWYGLILSRKVDGTKQMLLNVKLDKEKVKTLKNEPGFMPAYHMNKSSWISILLDQGIEDDVLMTLIKESHRFTETSSKSWIVPSKPSLYDVEHAFSKRKEILWPRKANIQVGDTVYIYLTAPIQEIRFECEVKEIDPENKTMVLQKQKKFGHEFSLAVLKEHGLISVRSARHIPEALERQLQLADR